MDDNATEAICTIHQFSSQLKHAVLFHDFDSSPSPEGFRLNTIIAERRERSERSEANNRVLFEIPRYLCIYIYIYICLSVRALHKTVHTLCKS